MARTPRLSPEALRLYLVTDRALAHGRDLEALVAQAVEGGVSCVQLREKAINTRDFLALATALQARLGPLGIPLFINDRVDIALACGAPGVHLGQSDLPVADARRSPAMDVFKDGQTRRVQEQQEGSLAKMPELPSTDAAATAVYIEHVLQNLLPVPAPIALQVQHILREVKA